MSAERQAAFKRLMAGRGQVLIVEDEPHVASSLKHLLASRGLESTIVYYAEDGIALLKAMPFSLAMVNLSLPKMNGRDFIHWCNEHRREMPCVVVSGLEIEDIVRECTSVKILMALTKPVTLHDIENLLLQLKLLWIDQGHESTGS